MYHEPDTASRASRPARAKRESMMTGVVGLLPAAGWGKRISPLPCSKELFPVGFGSAEDGNVRPKVVSHYLLEKMRSAGITEVYCVLRDGKWDIPAYFGDGAALDLNIAYVVTSAPWGPPYTIDQAYPFIRERRVAFGFPDIIFHPNDAYVKLLRRQTETTADVVLGLFPYRDLQIADVVTVSPAGRVISIAIKPRRSRSTHTWLAAVWTPVFSRFLNRYVASLKRRRGAMRAAWEISVGHVFREAVRKQLRFESVIFENDDWIDIGTPTDLAAAVRASASLGSNI